MTYVVYLKMAKITPISCKKYEFDNLCSVKLVAKSYPMMSVLKSQFSLFVLILLANSSVICIYKENVEDNEFEIVTESTTKLGSIDGNEKFQSFTFCLIYYSFLTLILVLTYNGNTCSGSFQVYALNPIDYRRRTIMSMAYDQRKDRGTKLRNIIPRRNFANIRMSYRNNGNCCWQLYKRYYFIIHIQN